MLTTETTAADLALVAGSDPSAVLLVDLATREVVFTNAVADQARARRGAAGGGRRLGRRRPAARPRRRAAGRHRPPAVEAWRAPSPSTARACRPAGPASSGCSASPSGWSRSR
nr:hypothetical protein [Angustibacter aerolatus]